MIASDDELSHALAADLPGHFGQLVERFQQRLFAFALRLAGSRQEAEDVLQEALLGAYVSLEGYSQERIRTLRLQAWLYKVVLHTYQHQQRTRRPCAVPLVVGDDGAEIDVEDTAAERPEQIIERLEQRHELLALLAQLPERYRVPVTCYYLEHLSYQEIANLLDQPLGTIKSAIHRGVAQLRGLLISAGKEDQPWSRPIPNPQNR